MPVVIRLVCLLAQYSTIYTYLSFIIFFNLNGIITPPPKVLTPCTKKQAPISEQGIQIISGISKRKIEQGQRLTNMIARHTPEAILQIYLSKRGKQFHCFTHATLYQRVAITICWVQNNRQSRILLRQCGVMLVVDAIDGQGTKGKPTKQFTSKRIEAKYRTY